jgi:hypothetical protein
MLKLLYTAIGLVFQETVTMNQKRIVACFAAVLHRIVERR